MDTCTLQSEKHKALACLLTQSNGHFITTTDRVKGPGYFARAIYTFLWFTWRCVADSGTGISHPWYSFKRILSCLSFPFTTNDEAIWLHLRPSCAMIWVTDVRTSTKPTGQWTDLNRRHQMQEEAYVCVGGGGVLMCQHQRPSGVCGQSEVSGLNLINCGSQSERYILIWTSVNDSELWSHWFSGSSQQNRQHLLSECTKTKKGMHHISCLRMKCVLTWKAFFLLWLLYCTLVSNKLLRHLMDRGPQQLMLGKPWKCIELKQWQNNQ